MFWSIWVCNTIRLSSPQVLCTQHRSILYIYICKPNYIYSLWYMVEFLQFRYLFWLMPVQSKKTLYTNMSSLPKLELNTTVPMNCTNDGSSMVMPPDLTPAILAFVRRRCRSRLRMLCLGRQSQLLWRWSTGRTPCNSRHVGLESTLAVL